MKNIDIHKLKENTANPRTITDEKFKKLINSILSFPEMLNIRPIIITRDNIVLGGNMRAKALLSISQMTETQIVERMATISDFNKKSKSEKDKIMLYWSAWIDAPIVPTISAEDLTDAQQKQFIITDNATFGTWDWDALANGWDSSELNDWGLDVWETKDIDIDHFFKEAENGKGKEQKSVICPHCGKNIYAPVEESEEKE